MKKMQNFDLGDDSIVIAFKISVCIYLTPKANTTYFLHCNWSPCCPYKL